MLCGGCAERPAVPPGRSRGNIRKQRLYRSGRALAGPRICDYPTRFHRPGIYSVRSGAGRSLFGRSLVEVMPCKVDADLCHRRNDKEDDAGVGYPLIVSLVFFGLKIFFCVIFSHNQKYEIEIPRGFRHTD